MTTLTDNRILFDLCLWLVAGIALLALVSCSPLAAYEPTPTPEKLTIANNPLPYYWQLATVRPRLHINPATEGRGRIGY
jgi:hypothetical protein